MSTKSTPGRKQLRLTACQSAAVTAKTTGATRREIAASLGISPAAVKQRLWRARRRAAAYLKSQGKDVPGFRSGEPPAYVKAFSLLPTDHV